VFLSCLFFYKQVQSKKLAGLLQYYT